MVSCLLPEELKLLPHMLDVDSEASQGQGEVEGRVPEPRSLPAASGSVSTVALLILLKDFNAILYSCLA